MEILTEFLKLIPVSLILLALRYRCHLSVIRDRSVDDDWSDYLLNVSQLESKINHEKLLIYHALEEFCRDSKLNSFKFAHMDLSNQLIARIHLFLHLDKPRSHWILNSTQTVIYSFKFCGKNPSNPLFLLLNTLAHFNNLQENSTKRLLFWKC